jgi:hypothetical protein
MIFSSVKFLEDQSMELLSTLAKGYYSNKMLVKLEVVRNLMSQYRVIFTQTLPLCISNPKSHQSLYHNLACMWICDDVVESIEVYLEPLGVDMVRILTNPTSRDLIFLFRELKGIVMAMQTQRTYSEFYEWFSEYLQPLIVRTIETSLYDGEVMNNLLKFLNELVNHKNSRIRFDVASANGVILFKEVSKVIVGYGKLLTETAPSGDVYNLKYRRMKLLISMMSRLMGGGYVNFGVFKIYGDTCFVEALGACFAMIKSVSGEDLLVRCM